MSLRHALIFLLLLVSLSARSQLTCDFSANVTVGCPPLVVQFTANVSGGSNYTYSWDLGNFTTVTPATNSMPSTTYTAPGTYTVRLTVYSGSSSATKTKTAYIIVRDTPVVNFSASPLIGCPPLTVAFTNNTIAGGTGTNTYNWYFGDGSAVNHSLAPTHPYNNSTATTKCHTVTLNVVNSYGCSGTKSSAPNYVCVYPKPVINFSAPQNHCSTPATTVFTATATGVGPFTYSWDFGDGPPLGTGNPVSHQYNGSLGSSYTVKLTVTDANGCQETLIKTNYIKLVANNANFTAPASACVHTPVTFTSSGSPALAGADWKFNDPQNGTATGLAPTYTFSTPGTYNVRMIGYVAGCPDTVIKQIIIHPQPNVDFTYTPSQPCPAPATLQFNPNPTTGITNYFWDFGVPGPITSTASNPVYTYQNKCFYTPTLIVTDNNGCKDTVQKIEYVKIYDLIVKAKANNREEDSGCIRPIQFTVRDSTSCPGPGLSPYPYPIASCLWDFGNSNYSTAINPIYTYPDTGIYRVIVTVTTTNGCVGKDTLLVKVGVKCTPYFYAITDTHICVKNTVCFLDTSIHCPITQMRWEVLTYDTVINIIGGVPVKVPHVTSSYEQKGLYNPYCYKFNVSDTYTVKLVTYHHGCATDTFTRYRYVIVDSPTARFTYEHDCDTPLLVKFKNKSIGATSWTWVFGDNTSSVGDTAPKHIYPAYGSYTPYIATYNSRSGCRDTFAWSFTLADPSVLFSAADTTLCIGDTVQMAGSYVGGNPTMYSWFIDNAYIYSGFGNTFQYPMIYVGQGYHTVMLVIDDDHNCRDTLRKINYLFVSKPVAADTAMPIIGCLPLTVNFTDNSTTTPGATITNRLWYYGTGSPVVVSGTTSSYTYTAVGDYDVKLTITDNIGCKDSVIKPKYIQVHKPTASFFVQDTGCVKEQIAFLNTSSIVDSSFWDFGDNTTSKNHSPSHAYATTGSYTVRLIVKDSYGCRDTITKVAKVNIIKPVANFTMSDSITVCAPLTVNFTNTSVGASSYYWVLGSGNTSTLKDVTEIYLYPGIYNIKLVATNNFGCTDTVVKQVKILGYAGAFSYTPLIGCRPLEVFFTPQLSNVANIVWDFNDGTTLSTSGFGTISHIYNTPGSYIPKLIITDAQGCKASSLGIDTIKVDAAVASFNTGPACEYTTVQFSDSSWGYFSNPAAWYWVFHDGSLSNKQNPTFNYGPPGKYSVKLVTTTTRGCKDSIVKDVIINPLPDIDAGKDTVICLKDSATLIPSGGISYTWSPASFLSCTSCANPLAFPPNKFKYTVIGTDANGCKNTDTVSVGIKTKVESEVGPGGEVCDEESFQLEVKGGRSYVWTPIDWLNDNKIANPLATPRNTIKYKVVAYEASCIPDTNFVDITVHPLPTVKASGEQTIIAGNSAVIQASGDLIKKFMWSPADNLSCSNCADPTAKPTKTTVYTVVVYSEYGCTDTDQVTIKVLCDESQLFIPNTFTPNGDGQNDVFYPRGNGIDKIKTFRIYNRWGEVVYERAGIKINDESVAWDGTRNGTKLPPDVFVYIVEAECDNGEIMTIKGDVTIIR